MRFIKYFCVFSVFFVLQSCTGTRIIDVKSPCVSTDDGPCGPRKPINTWLNNKDVA